MVAYGGFYEGGTRHFPKVRIEGLKTTIFVKNNPKNAPYDTTEEGKTTIFSEIPENDRLALYSARHTWSQFDVSSDDS